MRSWGCSSDRTKLGTWTLADPGELLPAVHWVVRERTGHGELLTRASPVR
jgi:hypothetical protein